MIDAHCHVDQYADPHGVVREAERQNILTVAVTNLPSHFEAGYPHVRGSKQVRLALGLHPLLADQHDDGELGRFEGLLAKTSYVGEVGLDYSRAGKAMAARQLDGFRFVLSTIRDRPRFITLHSRGAETDVLELLDEHGIAGAVFHWYSGPPTLVDDLVSAGHYLSINPAMVRSTNGLKIVERAPEDRVLTETDGPYSKVGRRQARPVDVARVLGHLAMVWGCSRAGAQRQVRSNFGEILDPVRQWHGTPH